MLEMIENGRYDALAFYAMVRVIIILICWIFSVFANFIDFWSGTATAKALGQPLMSHGFRRTVTKIGDYVKVMMFALMFDVLGGLLSFYILPFASILCTLAVLYIEGKSVIENAKRRKTGAAGVPRVIEQIINAATKEQGIEVLTKIATMLTSKKQGSMLIEGIINDRNDEND